MSRRRFLESSGVSLIDLLCAALLAAILLSMAIPQTAAGLSQARTRAAASYLAARLQHARIDAAARGSHVALRITLRQGDLSIAGFKDGNHNGIRSADIASGIDPQTDAEVVLGHLFPQVAAADVSGDPVPGTATGTTLFSFGPTGTASSGTVYLRGASDGQYAVRVLGATGRVRVLRRRLPQGDWIDVR